MTRALRYSPVFFRRGCPTYRPCLAQFRVGSLIEENRSLPPIAGSICVPAGTWGLRKGGSQRSRTSHTLPTQGATYRQRRCQMLASLYWPRSIGSVAENLRYYRPSPTPWAGTEKLPKSSCKVSWPVYASPCGSRRSLETSCNRERFSSAPGQIFFASSIIL